MLKFTMQNIALQTYYETIHVTVLHEMKSRIGHSSVYSRSLL